MSMRRWYRLLDEVSSDSRLTKFATTTLGLKYGYAIGKNSELSVRGEFMNQAFDDAMFEQEKNAGT